LKTIKLISDANRTTRKGFNSHEPASIARRGEREKGLLRPTEQGIYTRPRRFGLLDVQQGTTHSKIKSNTMNIIETIKKYPKDAAIVLTVIILGLMAVLGGHNADAANSKFWATVWQVLQVVGIVALIGGWIWAVKNDRDHNKK
jgi:uncharacterized integral membrane protein